MEAGTTESYKSEDLKMEDQGPFSSWASKLHSLVSHALPFTMRELSIKFPSHKVFKVNRLKNLLGLLYPSEQ